MYLLACLSRHHLAETSLESPDVCLLLDGRAIYAAIGQAI
jgi:hypothetical protein